MTTGLRALTLNHGSSSLKAAVYAIDAAEVLLAAADVNRIGLENSRIRIANAAGSVLGERRLEVGDHASAVRSVLDWLDHDPELNSLDVVAHRIVHGGDFTDPQLITAEVVGALRRLRNVDPDHLPQALSAIETIAGAYPAVPQVACFDTAFHCSMPPVAQRYPLPSRFHDAGVRRYGFHGLSCEYIMTALRALDPTAAGGRVIVAHLGNGASLTAVHHGVSVDTTMGFSPAGGVMMGTRPGDLDPGALLYMLRDGRMSLDEINELVNRGAGLLGVSGSSPDMQDLLGRESRDPQAAVAVALFCYLAKKSLGALMAVLGGVDTLIFTAGIGEHSVSIRERITSGLESWGISIDPARNAAAFPLISTDDSRVAVRVMKTDEELILARHARRLLLSRSRATD